MKATARRRFIPGQPVKAGFKYRYVVNNKAYVFQANYDKTLAEFNPIWFKNLTPKEYHYLSDLMPEDSVIWKGNRVTNQNIGKMSIEEVTLLMTASRSEKIYSSSLITGTEDHRDRVIDIIPAVNSNYEELKYHQIDNASRYVGITLLKINRKQTFVLNVVEAMTPIRAVSSNGHYVTIAFPNHTVTFVDTVPYSTTATSATFIIPAAVGVKKLIIEPVTDSSVKIRYV